jgi:hypothetical protein
MVFSLNLALPDRFSVESEIGKDPWKTRKYKARLVLTTNLTRCGEIAVCFFLPCLSSNNLYTLGGL